MQQIYSQQRDLSSSSMIAVNGTFVTARKHLLILRHSLDCRQKYMEELPYRCPLFICSEMRKVLDHIFKCSQGDDCQFTLCVTCKRLKCHADNCNDSKCPICTNCVSSDSFASDNEVTHSEVHTDTRNKNPLENERTPQYKLNSLPPQLAQPVTNPIVNGYKWQDVYDLLKRENIIKSSAEQVFPPATYNDDRAEAVFTLFKDQEEKFFNECVSEEDYKNCLQRFVSRVRDELKLKSRHTPLSFANDSLIPPSALKVDDATLSIHQLLESNALPIKASNSPTTNLPDKFSTAAGCVDNNLSTRLKEESPSDTSQSSSSADKAIVKSDSTGALLEVKSHQNLNEKPDKRCKWTKEQLSSAFSPIVNHLSNERFAQPFLTPVPLDDPKLMDYSLTVQNPMDLSTIQDKLCQGKYSDPWEVVDDFWLIFNNAWRYNKKASKVYRSCSMLAETFQKLIDPLMRRLGFCCGHEFVHYPHVLTCVTDKSCNINRNDAYYLYENSGINKNKDLLDKYIVCERCYESSVKTITIDDQSSVVHLEKNLFKMKLNNIIIYEKFVNCRECGRKWHKVCACYMEEIWPSGFVCQTCIDNLGYCRSPNRFTAKRLPTCKLSEFLEKRVNDFMKKTQSSANEVIIRVVASTNKTVEVKNYMRKMYCDGGKFPETFPYRTKVLFAFQESEGQEVCFFGLYVQEYSSDCPAPNKRRVYIAYLDSVYFFQPKQYRTDIYHEILIGYLHYAKKQGFATAHIWACPPGEGDDYIFHMHPADQKIPKSKRLQDWYRKMLQKAHNERIVVDYNNIYQDASDTNCLTPIDLPYFDGDLWPNTMEEILKTTEENRRKPRDEGPLRGEADEAEDEDDSNQGSLDSDRKPGSVGNSGINDCMKKTKKRKIKRAASSLSAVGGSKRKRFGVDAESDVQKRLEEMLQRNAEAFLTINLHSRSQVASLQPIKDPDPLFQSEIMECRDSFLSRARERHLEFSTLRRAKFSTLAFLYDIHTENKDAFIYSCNACQKEIETPRQCKLCANFYLCDDCFQTRGHQHPMEKIIISDDSTNTAAVQQSDRLKMEFCVQLLEHTCSCRDANCRNQSCRDMKRRLDHFQSHSDRNKCCRCRPLHRILVAHSTKCNDSRCQVVFCSHYKILKKQHESEQRLRNVQTLRRRQKTMQCSNNNNYSKTPQQPNTPQPTPVVANPASVTLQFSASASSPSVFHTSNSSEHPHNIFSQTSITSPHSASNSHSPHSKPTQTASVHPTSLQHSHSSPYQLLPHPSPLPAAASVKGSISQQQFPANHLPSPSDCQPVSQVMSPYGQHPLMYQQSQQLMHHQQTRACSVDASLSQQNNNPVASSNSAGYYENGQSVYVRSPVTQVVPHMPYQTSTLLEREESYSAIPNGMGRHFLGDYHLIPHNSGSANMFPADCEDKPMMQRPMSVAMMPNDHHQHQMIHWGPGGTIMNGQMVPGTTMTGSRMIHMGASQQQHQQQQQQVLTTQQAPFVLHVGNTVCQPPSVEVIEMVLSARRNFTNEYDFFTWLQQQQPSLLPAWNYCQNQQKLLLSGNPYPTPHSSPSQMMRPNGSFLHNQHQRSMMQPISNTWPMQQAQQVSTVGQDPRVLRPPCYGGALGNPAYVQMHQQQQQQPSSSVMINNSYAVAGFPPLYQSSSSSGPVQLEPGGASGSILRNQVVQHQFQRSVSESSRPPTSPKLQQQSSLMLSQLLVHSQSQPQLPHRRLPQDQMPPQQTPLLPH